RLRGHHLVCLHFYRGEGYSPDFVARLGEVVQRAGAGEEVEVVAGADDVCRACPYLADEQCAHRPGAEAGIQALDRTARSFLGVSPGDRVRWGEIKARVEAAPEEWFAAFCAGCGWRGLCERVRGAGR
ncbi:MAG: DUF1284 domain-containing protein, partial [Bacillota bacterium]|nr:DUF1284 domain-containing protein [Bacillota bacterium]